MNGSLHAGTGLGMGLFGKPRQVKDLDNHLTATRIGFGMFDRMPAANQAMFLERGPTDVAIAARAAVRAGHTSAAGELLATAASSVPPGATAEQWQRVIDAGNAALTET